MKALMLTLLIVISLASCNKDKDSTTPISEPKTNSSDDWYIFDHYSVIDFDLEGSDPIVSSMGVTGLDHLLDLRSDGTIYYYVKNVPQVQPVAWGYHSNTTITHGTGGQDSYEYQITNKTSSIIEAKHMADEETTFYLTLKK